ncbi:MAG: hypothetical protein NVS2B16_06760 [Chloroflexota bacterium]
MVVRVAFLSLLAFFASLSPADARPAPPPKEPRSHESAMLTFTLRVVGPSDPQATYWVAYGPLAGRFGMVRLQRVGLLFQAAVSLPSHGHTVFAYLQGHGIVRTRAGDAPAPPMVTIASMGPVSVSGARFPTIAWHAPIG